MADNMLEYKDLFLQTSKENLQLLNDCLLKLEKTPDDSEAIAETFRAAHSLKGEGAAMGFEQLAYLCHAIEDAFAEIKEGRQTVTSELADVLFRAYDAIQVSLDSIESSSQETADVSQYIENIKKLTGVTTSGSGKSLAHKPQEPAPTAQQSTPIKHQAIKTIPIKIEQLDEMMNLIEELVIDRLVLKQLTHEIGNDKLRSYYEKAGRTSEALQFQVMKIRAVPIKMVFDHFPRAVRDLARLVNKDINLVIEGGDLELDRTLVEQLDEPLTHLIRNAADHGLKPAGGTIRLSARREQDYAIIEVADDGDGIDWQALAEKAGVVTSDPARLHQLLFSGISTAEAVTQISGRGVGLGAVKKTVEDFGGTITVDSQAGQGTTFRIKLPLTLAVIQALVVRVGLARYVIPAPAIDRSIKIAATARKKTAEQEVFVLDGLEIPLISLSERFTGTAQAMAPGSNPVDTPPSIHDALAVVVLAGKERVALIVDDVLEASQIIVKPVPTVLKANRMFGGTTILGDGQSALLLNPAGLL